jgi:hypothetical protein
VLGEFAARVWRLAPFFLVQKDKTLPDFFKSAGFDDSCGPNGPEIQLV